MRYSLCPRIKRLPSFKLADHPPSRRQGRRRALFYTLFFLGLWLAALLMLWPAQWLAAQLSRATQDTWRLEHASGRLWQGSGVLLHRHSREHPWQMLQALSWQIHMPQLPSQLPITLTLEQGRIELMLSPGNFEIRHLEVRLPARTLLNTLPGALSRYHWRGDMSLHSTHYRCQWRQPHCTGQASLLWHQAAVAEIPGPPLGDYRFELNAQERATQLKLTTLDGHLRLQGQGEISRHGQLSFQGIAHVSASPDDSAENGVMPLADSRLHELLAMLGRPMGGGRYRIEYREP